MRPESVRPGSASIGLALVAAALLAAPAPAFAQAVRTSHGVSVFGDLKYQANFTHFAYVNPDAPKGGTFRLWGLDTFETLNTYILKGQKEVWNALIFDTLMVRAFDEPDALYGLVAAAVELPKDKSWVGFRLRPRARFHDGTPITADDAVFTYRILVEKGHPQFRILFRDVAGAEALGRHHVRVHLQARFPPRPAGPVGRAPGAVQGVLRGTPVRQDDLHPAVVERSLPDRRRRSGPGRSPTSLLPTTGRVTCRSIAGATISTASGSTITATATSPSRRSSPASTTCARSSPPEAGRPSTTSRRSARS